MLTETGKEESSLTHQIETVTVAETGYRNSSVGQNGSDEFYRTENRTLAT